MTDKCCGQEFFIFYRNAAALEGAPRRLSPPGHPCLPRRGPAAPGCQVGCTGLALCQRTGISSLGRWLDKGRGARATQGSPSDMR